MDTPQLLPARVIGALALTLFAALSLYESAPRAVPGWRVRAELHRMLSPIGFGGYFGYFVGMRSRSVSFRVELHTPDGASRVFSPSRAVRAYMHPFFFFSAALHPRGKAYHPQRRAVVQEICRRFGRVLGANAGSDVVIYQRERAVRSFDDFDTFVPDVPDDRVLARCSSAGP